MASSRRETTQIKPKIGVLFFTSGWFRDVGLQQDGENITADVEELSRQIIYRLQGDIEVIHCGVLYTESRAAAAGKLIAQQSVQGVLLIPLMWCEDQIFRAALSEMPDVPLLLWTLSPQKSLPEYLEFQTALQGTGIICTFQVSGMLHRENRRYASINGHHKDEDVYRELIDHCRSMAVARMLGETRVGVLPFPCDQMSTTFVDEFSLRTRYGVELKYLELERVRASAQDVPIDAIQSFVQELKSQRVLVEVDETNLLEAVRYSIALERIVHEYHLDMLGMNDVIDEMHSSFGLRPCLTNSRLTELGIFVSMEADIGALVAMYCLGRYTGSIPMYVETFNADYEANALLLAHAGYHDWINHDPDLPVKIISDIEYQNSDRFTGAVPYFKYRPGPVTLVNSVWNGQRLKWTVVEGESLSGPFKLEGNAHLFCRINPELKSFIDAVVESGISQHWVVIPGHTRSSIKTLCTYLNVEFVAV